MSSQKAKGPKFVQYFGPVVEALNSLDGSGRPSEVRNWIAQKLNIADTEQSALLKGGGARFDNQVGWARFYLTHGGYLDSSQRGVWSLTEKGRQALGMTQADALEIFRQVHKQFAKSNGDKDIEAENTTDSLAPSNSSSTEESSYRTELLKLLLSLPPAGFERLCKRLLREAGFEEVEVTGRSGDGGIDGWGRLQLNAFVSFKVLFQCKRYSNAVVPSQVRDFRGAMQGRADKGLILTTGTFTADAQKEALRDGVPPIELVNGDKLLDMFENLELGLKQRKTFDIDLEFFQEFRLPQKNKMKLSKNQDEEFE